MNTQTYHLAFVFPGQGSQSIGMLNDLAANYPQIQQTFEQASDVLGKNLWALVTQGPVEALNETANTQPIMLAAGIAVWNVWCSLSDVRPAWLAGHSLGEYTALVCAGGMAFEDAIKLVALRGELMQNAIPAGVGAMAAIIGLEEYQVVNACAAAAENEIVSAANFNSPEQIVIAGHKAAVERAMLKAKEAGAKRALILPVSVPSHCALMQTAAQTLAAHLQAVSINIPHATLIHNVDVSAHNAPEVIANALKEQLYKPVRWVDSIRFMQQQGVTHFVECGPGRVLTGLNKRITNEAQHSALSDTAALNTLLEYTHARRK